MRPREQKIYERTGRIHVVVPPIGTSLGNTRRLHEPTHKPLWKRVLKQLVDWYWIPFE